MADKNYSNLTVIIALAKDCGKCTQMKRGGLMDVIIDGFKKKGIRVVEKECETRQVEIPYPPTNKLNEFLNHIVGWFPQFIVIPNSYYDNIDKYTVDELVAVSATFNGTYATKDEKGNPFKDNRGKEIKGKTVNTEEYAKFVNENFVKFFDKYMSSAAYKNISTSSTSVGPGPAPVPVHRPAYIPNYTPSYSSAPRIGTQPSVQTRPVPNLGPLQRTSGLNAPSSTTPANKDPECKKLEFVLFKRGI